VMGVLDCICFSGANGRVLDTSLRHPSAGLPRLAMARDVGTPPSGGHVALSETPSPLPAPKRRRITGKTSPAVAAALSLVPEIALPELGEPTAVPDEEDEDLPVDSYVKKRLHNAYYFWWQKRSGYHSASLKRQRQLNLYYSLRGLSQQDRERRLSAFARDMPQYAPMLKAYLKHFEPGYAGAVAPTFSCVATWQGSWGLLLDALGGGEPTAASSGAGSSWEPSPQPAAPVALDDSDCHASTRGAPSLDPEADLRVVEAAASALRADRRCQDLWQEVLDAVKTVQEAAPSSVQAWALELCPRTLLQSGSLRVHAHVAVVAQNGRPLRIPWERALFRGSPPSHVSRNLGDKQGKRVRNALAALSYLALPKCCSVWADCSVELFVDLPVSAQHIFNAVGARKMSVRMAHDHLIKIPKAIDRNLDQLERYRSEQCTKAIAAVQEWRLARAAGARLPFKRYGAVSHWLAQYDYCLDRYLFLVLDGPSRLGKTAFMRHLEAPFSFCEINCSGGQSLDLRSYRVWQHNVVFFDEAKPAQVLANKKLFQAGPLPVQLQTSMTNCFAYSIWLGGKKLCIAANDWMLEVSKLNEADRDWLGANSVYLAVTEPMWEPEHHRLAVGDFTAV